MIFMLGRSPIGNILHGIMGAETRLWLDMHGAVTMDVTDLVQRAMRGGRQVFLHLTNCEREATTQAALASAAQAGVSYPFIPPAATYVTPVFFEGAQADPLSPPSGIDPTAPGVQVVSADNIQDVLNTLTSELFAPPPDEPSVTADTPKEAIPGMTAKPKARIGTCSRCHSTDIELVPRVHIAICFNCADIDLHMAVSMNTKELAQAKQKKLQRTAPKKKNDNDAPPKDN